MSEERNLSLLLMEIIQCLQFEKLYLWFYTWKFHQNARYQIQNGKIHEVGLEETGNFILKGRSIGTVSSTVVLEIMQYSSEAQMRYEGLILSQEFSSSNEIIPHRYYR